MAREAIGGPRGRVGQLQGRVGARTPLADIGGHRVILAASKQASGAALGTDSTGSGCHGLCPIAVFDLGPIASTRMPRGRQF